MSTVVALKNVSKSFGSVKAVDSLSFTVKKGEIVGFVGSNGAGKSTTINMLLGFIKPTTGSVMVFDEATTPQAAHKQHAKIGFASGDMALFDTLTGQQYLDFLSHQYGSKVLREELLDTLGPVLHRKIKHLSRGNKQKIALIGALQHRPELIILDEPTSGLDPIMQQVFIDTIEQQKKRGATVFMSSHILSEVASLATRIICLKEGKIVLDIPAAEIDKDDQKHVMVKLSQDSIRVIKTKGLVKGASKQKLKGSVLHFTFQGDPNALIRWLVTLRPLDMTIENESLDDLFTEIYSSEARK